MTSGDTEREALPHLLGHLDLATPLSIYTAPHGKLTTAVAERLARAAYWEAHARGSSPDKIVVLTDADGRGREVVEHELEYLSSRLANLGVPVLIRSAEWHLEAWFFADPRGLRAYLSGRSPGLIGQSPDEIVRPKLRLENLLRNQLALPYTARISGAIASCLDPERIRDASPSFRRFEDAVRNGGAP